MCAIQPCWFIAISAWRKCEKRVQNVDNKILLPQLVVYEVFTKVKI